MFRKVQHAPRYAKQSTLFVRTSEETQPKTFRKKSMSLGRPLKPIEKYQYMGYPIKPIRENIKYPRGLPRSLLLDLFSPLRVEAVVHLSSEGPSLG